MKNSIVLFLILIFTVEISAQTAKKEVIAIPDLNSIAEIEGIVVNVKSSGTVTLTPMASGLHVYVDVLSDLTDFQRKAGEIVRAGMNADVECNYALNFSGADVIPDRCNEVGGCQFAKITLTGRYKDKRCIFGVEKTLVNQDFTSIVNVNPEVTKTGLSVRAQVTDVTAGGVMGALMNLEVIHSKVIAMINEKIAKATESTQ